MSSQPTPLTYTLNAGCAAARISRSKLYQLWNAGEGPRFYTVGTRRYITHDSLIEWMKQREAAAGGAA